MSGYDDIDFRVLERTRWPEYLADLVTSALIRPSDIIVVSGFWRSGTTWIQQALARLLTAKTVFEPFHPATTRGLYRTLLAGKDDAFRENFMPYGDGSFGEELDRFARAALWARVPQAGLRIIRTGRREALRTRIVAKTVRAHLCLHRISRVSGTPVLHLVRDVRAIVASVGMTDWAWQFENLSLRAQLLEVDDERAEVFERWRPQIERYDREDVSARIAAYWCLAEDFVQSRVTRSASGNLRVLRYRDLVEDPVGTLAGALAAIGPSGIAADELAAALGRDSATTSSKRRGGLSTEERIWGWQSKLDPATVRRVEDIAADFGMAEHLIEA